MRLALLCDDPAVVPWLDAMAGGSAHEVVVAATVSPRGSELLRGRAGIRLTSQWEELLIARDIDAVLVGGSEPSLLEAVRQLATAGQSILFLPQAAQGSTFLYELGLIRDDNRVRLFPALVHRRDPALVRLRSVLRDGSLGTVQLIQFEREVSGCEEMSRDREGAVVSHCHAPLPHGRGSNTSQPLSGSSPTGALPQAVVNAALLPDIDLLRWLSGDYDQVTALRTGAANEAVLMQTVTLAGRGLPEATWHVQSTDGIEVSRLTVHAERGRTVVERDPVSNEWVLTEPGGAQVVGNRVASARELLDEFAASLTGSAASAEWPELVKDFETLDATQRSVTRRRTIELHFEPMSERATFKTQMTAMGCGVLVGTFLLLLAYLALASLVPQSPKFGDPPDGWELMRSGLFLARAVVFAPVAIFLVLQLLYPLTRPTSGATNAAATHDSP